MRRMGTMSPAGACVARIVAGAAGLGCLRRPPHGRSGGGRGTCDDNLAKFLCPNQRAELLGRPTATRPGERGEGATAGQRRAGSQPVAVFPAPAFIPLDLMGD